MGNVGKAARYLIICITFLFTLANIQSCSIKEDFSNCNNDNEDFLLYIKVVDIVTGKDMTESGEIDKAYLYLFDSKRNFVKTYEISAEQIAKREPIIFKHDELDGAMVSAWGNLGENVNRGNPEVGNLPHQSAVSLLQNPIENEYDLSPNDFFFGMKEIDDKSHITHTKEVVITQKNAKLHITVRGIEDDKDENYYFNIAHQHNGYDFRGNPTEKNSNVKETGIFNNNGDYISPNPYLLIHSPKTQQATEENSIWIHFYKKESEGTQEIVNTNKDITGNYIVLTSGQTTNILMDIRDNGTINIYVQVTPWDEIYQWSEF